MSLLGKFPEPPRGGAELGLRLLSHHLISELELGLQVEGWALPDHELRSTLTPPKRLLSHPLVIFGALLPIMCDPFD